MKWSTLNFGAYHSSGGTVFRLLQKIVRYAYLKFYCASVYKILYLVGSLLEYIEEKF